MIIEILVKIGIGIIIFGILFFIAIILIALDEWVERKTKYGLMCWALFLIIGCVGLYGFYLIGSSFLEELIK